MFESLIDLAAGWILPGLFFWAVLSLFAMTVQDWIGEILMKRSHYLKKGISQMLGEDSLVDTFFTHPLLLSQGTPERRLKRKNDKPYRVPAYIASRIFAQILLDRVLQSQSKDEGKENLSVDKLREKLVSFSSAHPKLGAVLTMLFTAAGIDDPANKVDDVLRKAQEGIQNWFDDCMQDLTRWYRIYTRKTLLVIGVLLALYTNFDIITLTSDLWSSQKTDELVRSQIEQLAQPADPNLTTDDQMRESFELISLIEKATRLPIGWYTEGVNSETECSFMRRISFTIPLSADRCLAVTGLPSVTDPFGWMIKLIGLLAGGAAIAIGAQFTYDTLVKRPKAA